MSSVKDRFAYLVAVPMACCLFVQRSVDDRAKGQLHCTDKAHTGGGGHPQGWGGDHKEITGANFNENIKPGIVTSILTPQFIHFF